MFTRSAMLFYYCETPLHAGSGSSMSYIDLPIQREKHTDYPIVQSGGVKGAFRDWAEEIYVSQVTDVTEKKANRQKIIKVFGPEPKKRNENENDPVPADHGGSLSFTDARILLFPVRSFEGGFAWITSPIVIDRLLRSLEMIGCEELPQIDLSPVHDEKVIISDSCALVVNHRQEEQQIILEDFVFYKEEDADQQELASLADWIAEYAFPAAPVFTHMKTQLADRLLILSDTHFRDFVRHSTQVVTRISIGETGTVEKGALWTQELLPTDCLLYSLALAKDMIYRDKLNISADNSIDFLKTFATSSKILQMGGDETVGRGIVRLRYLEMDEREAGMTISEEKGA